MGIAAALLGQLLTTNADINWLTSQQIYWNSMYEANAAKLSKQQTAEEKFYDESAKAIDNTRELHAGRVTVKEDNRSEYSAELYAHAKVHSYDAALSEELAALDIEYDTMVTMYEAALEQARAQQQGEKTAVQNACQDTGLLQS